MVPIQDRLRGKRLMGFLFTFHQPSVMMFTMSHFSLLCSLNRSYSRFETKILLLVITVNVLLLCLTLDAVLQRRSWVFWAEAKTGERLFWLESKPEMGFFAGVSFFDL